MTMLSALAKAFDRLSDAPPAGFSEEKISFVIALNANGTPANSPIDLRTGEGRKRTPRLMPVPQPGKRTAGIAPNFLWDKTSYALGVTAGEGRRSRDEHAAFVARHNDQLAGTADPGLRALLAFLAWWVPERFATLGWPEEMRDQNVVFALEADRLDGIFLHDRTAAGTLLAQLSAGTDKTEAVCLVTGELAPVARLHPAIKGVWGAQSSGGAIVSYNLDAFESYGHEQGENAPVSEAAAFAYTTVLNRFLARDSGNRIQIGDASTVFWADASDAESAATAEHAFVAMFEDVDERIETAKVGAMLAQIRAGQPLAAIAPDLEAGVRFYVLGLAPNAARLSIRFWLDDDFSAIARHYQRFVADIRIEPPPRDPFPAFWKYLAETAVLGKRENVPPNLAGDWLRAVLTGTPYPLTLMSMVLMRIRADHEINGLRVGMLRAVLVRNFGMAMGNPKGKTKEAPVSLDPENRNKGYLLGRLFATYEYIQTAALGNLNATIKDKFYGAASSQPRKIFHLLDSGSTNHLSKIGKESFGRRINLEKQVGSIMEVMEPDDDPFPAHLSSREQALFSLGYYHQRNDLYVSKTDKNTAASEETDQ